MESPTPCLKNLPKMFEEVKKSEAWRDIDHGMHGNVTPLPWKKIMCKQMNVLVILLSNFLLFLVFYFMKIVQNCVYNASQNTDGGGGGINTNLK